MGHSTVQAYQSSATNRPYHPIQSRDPLTISLVKSLSSVPPRQPSPDQNTSRLCYRIYLANEIYQVDRVFNPFDTNMVPRLCRLARRAGLQCSRRSSLNDRRREPSYPGSGDLASPWTRGTRRGCAGLGRRSSSVSPETVAENSLPHRTHLPAGIIVSNQNIRGEKAGYHSMREPP